MNFNDKIDIKLSRAELSCALYALIEVKFSSNSNDQSLMASPILANVAKVLANAMIENHNKIENYNKIENHNMMVLREWLNFRLHIDLWDKALIYARNHFKSKWEEWSDSGKSNHIGELVSPFYLTSIDYDFFVKLMLE